MPHRNPQFAHYIMKSTLKFCLGALASCALTFASVSAHAGPYTQMVVFGDSLSDNGNVFAATGGGLPVFPYLPGRFSDGQVWVEGLATALGLPALTPSLLGGTNYAWGGARSGSAPGSVPGVLTQLAIWGGNPANAFADPNALYVVVAGGNDMRDARGASSTAVSRQAAADAAAGNIAAAVSTLASRGARHVLISNLPDLGNTFEAVLLGLVANSSDVSQRFSTAISGLEAMLEALFPNLDIDMLDMAGITAAVRTDALTNGGATYGITNATRPCGTFAGSAGAACNVSLFSDALHPSAAGHALLAQAALQLVPEPATPLLVALALMGLVVLRRRA